MKGRRRRIQAEMEFAKRGRLRWGDAGRFCKSLDSFESLWCEIRSEIEHEEMLDWNLFKLADKCLKGDERWTHRQLPFLSNYATLISIDKFRQAHMSRARSRGLMLALMF
jgi:hypothetical protein